MSQPKPAKTTSITSFVIGLVVIALAVSITAGAIVAYVDAHRPDPNVMCRIASRHAFSALVSDHPTMTKAQAQKVVYRACKGVTPADRKTIVDDERDAAIARYLTK